MESSSVDIDHSRPPTCFKEDLKASAAELVYGTTLRVPGEFFTTEEAPVQPQIFVEKFREYMRKLRPTPTAHHNKKSIFAHKDLYTCSHVFLHDDAFRKPLEPPYLGPFHVTKRIND